MRLIDADELIESISRNDDLPWNLDKVCQAAFISCLKHTKTAYDVDDVIKKLLSESLCMAADEEPFIMLDRAIEIVNEGR